MHHIKRINPTRIVTWLILITGAATMVFPFYWLIITSVKIPKEVIAHPPILIPSEISLHNFVRILTEMNFIRFFINSLYVSAIVTVITLLTSALMGYIFAKFRFRGRDVIFILILATMMIPFPVIMITLYLLIAKIGWVDTHLALIVPALFNTFGLFLMRQFMHSIPSELREAGRIDGASEFTIFFRVILPQAKPALAALAIFIFMWQWDNFLWPLIVLQSESKFILPLGLAMFSQQFWTDYGLVMAGATITILPILIVFLFMQRNFIKGITMTGIKG